MTIRMRKAGPGEILNREAIARSQDPNDALVASARPPSDSDECVSRVKQITLGLLMYSQDYDDTFPQQSWQGPLFPYVKDLSVFDCPALQKSGGRFGYALNGGLMGTRMAVIKQPDIVPAVFDSNLLGAGAIGDISNLANPPRHAEGNTMSYADGHVKVLPP
jgi:prepilin-type processing-associated H-X9-DG protein